MVSHRLQIKHKKGGLLHREKMQQTAQKCL